jgi:hypothetical protein
MDNITDRQIAFAFEVLALDAVTGLRKVYNLLEALVAEGKIDQETAPSIAAVLPLFDARINEISDMGIVLHDELHGPEETEEAA